MSNARSNKPEHLQGLVFHQQTITPAECLARWVPSIAYEPEHPVIGLDGKHWQQAKPAKQRRKRLTSSSPHAN